MVNALTWFNGSAGLAFIVANVLAGQTGLPLPAVPTLIVAGAMAVDHYRWGAEVFMGATVACLLADCCWYLFGRTYGSHVLRLLFALFPLLGSRAGGIRWPVERWGTKTFLIVKSIPGLAIVASPLAGAARMSFQRFLWLSAVGAGLWVGACLIAGALLQREIHDLLPRICQYGTLGICIMAVVTVGYGAFQWFERHKSSSPVARVP
jgi:membrane protein DedA with SNARE-associated domain